MSHNVAKELRPRHSPSLNEDSENPSNSAEIGAATHRCVSAGFEGRVPAPWLRAFDARSPELRGLPQSAICWRGSWNEVTDLVYFAECNSEFVKIGYAGLLRNRLPQLQIGNPYKITAVAVLRGLAPFERILHREFAECRHNGEWFRLSGRLKAFLALPAMVAARCDSRQPEPAAGWRAQTYWETRRQLECDGLEHLPTGRQPIRYSLARARVLGTVGTKSLAVSP